MKIVKTTKKDFKEIAEILRKEPSKKPYSDCKKLMFIGEKLI